MFYNEKNIKRVKSLITSTNTANAVMDYLKEQIINGGYKPGEKINIDELSKEIQISKIPIREALMQLQPIGLVDYTANVGMRVAAIDNDEAADILEVLSLLTGREYTLGRLKADGAMSVYQELMGYANICSNSHLKEVIQIYSNQLLLWREE
ncbi:regulatory protein, gntR family [Lactonifactor longoviformis DSM 17459]|uniref:Regulatory protein, gntR family n=2 Tax=Lactonifactor TaxID=420345 RepID=A0A1M4U095_9CLOT|nr:regulatory protein, gntR family [Lactonifactor longoviformis DSM 17459]